MVRQSQSWLSHLLHRRRIHRRLSSRGLLHLRRRFLRRYRSTSFQISHPHLQLRRRNQRAVSEPGEPPNLQDMFLTATSLVDHPVVERKLECNLRGFPVVIPAW